MNRCLIAVRNSSLSNGEDSVSHRISEALAPPAALGTPEAAQGAPGADTLGRRGVADPQTQNALSEAERAFAGSG